MASRFPLGAPQGEAFGRRFNVDNGSVVRFSARGMAVKTVHLPPDTETLKNSLEDLLARAGKYGLSNVGPFCHLWKQP
jgi:hypothetical protein